MLVSLRFIFLIQEEKREEAGCLGSRVSAEWIWMKLCFLSDGRGGWRLQGGKVVMEILADVGGGVVAGSAWGGALALWVGGMDVGDA